MSIKITALVENQSQCDLKSLHGLSLYVETPMHKLLFDIGPNKTLFQNAEKRGIDLAGVDTVIISHGHSDHGGALRQFLEINRHARIYIQETAFEKHYFKLGFIKADVGLDRKLSGHPRIIKLSGDYTIDEELSLFTVEETAKCHSTANDSLYAVNKRDDFSHEHNLILRSEENTVLIMGCGHAGVVNIMEKASKYNPGTCIGGYHLYNPMKKETVAKDILDSIIKELSPYSTKFYTCHCTGQEAFRYLSEHLDMSYLPCGGEIKL